MLYDMYGAACRQGVELWGLTIQNESENPGPWEACVYTPSSQVRVENERRRACVYRNMCPKVCVCKWVCLCVWLSVDVGTSAGDSQAVHRSRKVSTHRMLFRGHLYQE